MSEYPVHFDVAHPPRYSRLQLLIRLVAFCALGILGLSFGTAFVFGYLALPVFAAIRLGSHEPAAYLGEDGPRVTRILHWFAAASAWAGLLTDRLPSKAPAETVDLTVTPVVSPTATHPTPGSAMWRVLSGLPSAFVLALLGFVGGFVWLWAAITILVNEKVGEGAFHFLAGIQRWSLRLLAYQASLVDEYPPFSFTDTESPALPSARATP